MSGRPSPEAQLSRLHRLGARLVVLLCAVTTAFFLALGASVRLRAHTVQEAATLHRQGLADLAAGRTGSALDALRRAAVKDRGNLDYGLSLARALIANGQPDAARRVLLALRDSSPEQPDVNLALARLSAADGDLTSAVRFYRSAIYAPWSTDTAPRATRRELIELLLRHDERERAAAELMSARASAPDDRQTHVELGTLFRRAGDERTALDEFQRALRLDPMNRDAHRGAGLSAFALGDYAAAARELRAVTDPDEQARAALDTAVAVLQLDPLAPRIGAAERLRRVEAALAYLAARRCDRTASDTAAPANTAPHTTAPDDTPPPMLAAAVTEVRRSHGRNQDAVEDAVDRVTTEINREAAACGPPTATDRAYAIIGRAHRDTAS